ncbi:MAG: hypothetical protein R2795_03225 [Saprospiraceae bacterium]
MRFLAWLLCLLLMVGYLHTAKACDACGCSIMYLNLGLTPRFQNHQVTLGWRHQSFVSYLDEASRRQGITGSRELFQQLEVQVQWRIHDRIRLVSAVPYSFLSRSLAEGEWTDAGLADPSFLSQFVLIDQDKAEDKVLRHRLSVGVGVRLPLGRSEGVQVASQQVNFRLGTGSWAAIGYAQYVLRHQRWGISADILATKSGYNNDEYRYGDRWNSHLMLFGVFSKRKSGFMPSVGYYTEAAAKDIQRGFYRSDTGGSYGFVQAGMQFFRSSWSASLQYQLPVKQQWATGLTESRSRLACLFTYYL